MASWLPGDIAREITETIQSVPGAGGLGVGSYLGEGTGFAEKRHIPHAYGSYEELVSDPEIDIIHVATPIPSIMKICCFV